MDWIQQLLFFAIYVRQVSECCTEKKVNVRWVSYGAYDDGLKCCNTCLIWLALDYWIS